MALITCPECKKKISESAKSCPNCGYQLTTEKVKEIKKNEYELKKSLGIGCIFLIIILFILYITGLFSTNQTKKSTPVTKDTIHQKKKTKEEIRKEKIEIYFSAWDGSHIGLTKLIKGSMHDPSSYKHVETGYQDKGDHLIVKTTFRGKNVFGGIVMNWVIAKVDLEGNVLEIIEQGP